MEEPSYLELRGALDLLLKARLQIRPCGWEGTRYYVPPQADKDKMTILDNAMYAIRRELEWFYGNPKERRQSEALASVGGTRAISTTV